MLTNLDAPATPTLVTFNWCNMKVPSQHVLQGIIGVQATKQDNLKCKGLKRWYSRMMHVKRKKEKENLQGIYIYILLFAWISILQTTKFSATMPYWITSDLFWKLCNGNTTQMGVRNL